MSYTRAPLTTTILPINLDRGITVDLTYYFSTHFMQRVIVGSTASLRTLISSPHT